MDSSTISQLVLTTVFLCIVGILILILYRGLKSPNKPEVSTPTSRQTSRQDEKESEQDSKEDSEGDCLMLFNGPTFPPDDFNDD